MRDDGLPCGLTVARCMAFGSEIPAFKASLNHFSNWLIGSLSMLEISSVVREYSFLNSARCFILLCCAFAGVSRVYLAGTPACRGTSMYAHTFVRDFGMQARNLSKK